MGIEPRTISKADALAEAYKRGLLPPDKKAAYEEAQRRGLVGGQPAAVAQPVAPQTAPPAPVGKPGAGFEMAPSSPQARRDMMGAQPPQPMAAAPGAQYSWTPPAEAGTPEQFAAARTGMDARAKAEADRVAAEAQAAREAQLAAERREASRAYGAGMDMIISTDEQGQLRPGSGADADASKGILTSPQHGANAVIQAAESGLNLWPDALNGVFRKLNGSGNGLGNFNPDIVPRFSFPKVPIPEGMESFSGSIGEGLAQFLLSRKLVGSVAPGGGLAANLGKDAVAVGVGFDGSTGRMADMFDLNAIPEGPLRDYARFLQTQPDDSPIVGRFKNMLEDMTMSGPMLAPQGVVRAGQAVGNALTPKPMTPTNAGGAGVQATLAQSRAAPQPPPVARPAPAAAQPQPSVSPVAQPTVTQGPAGGAQPGATGAGQQAAGAVPPGPATLQASPTVQPVRVDPQVMADNKAAVTAVSRFMRGARVPRNDVNDYVATLLSRYEPLQSERYPLAFFIEDDLPQYLQSRGYTPEQARNLAGDVVAKTQGWGRAANSFNASGNSSRYTMQDTIHQLTTTQKDELSGTFREILGDETLIGRSDEIGALMRQNGEEAYNNSIAEANRILRDGTASPAQTRAAEEVKAILTNAGFREFYPESLTIEATTRGRTVEQLIAERLAADPIDAAHWLQSEIGKAERAARNMDGSPTNMSRAYEQMRAAILQRLETFPGYRGARMQHGDLYGAEDAVSFGDRFLSTARSEYKTDLMKREFDALSPRQQEVAALSIRDALLNPMLRGSPEDATARITQLQNEGTLKALVTVLGDERGEALRNAIASMRVENQRIAAISQAAGSNTHLNQQGAKDAIDNIRGPGNKLAHGVGNPAGWGMAVGADLMFGTGGAITAAKAAGSLFDKITTPGKKFQSRATRGLYGLRQADDVAPSGNALNAPPEAGALPKPKPAAKTGNKLKPDPAPRGQRPPPTAEQMGARIQKDQEELQRLLRQYDQLDRADPNIDDLMRDNLNKQRNARRRIAEKTKKLEALSQGPKPSPAAAPESAPKPAPAKTGGKKPPPGTTSMASPAVTGALVGGGIGAAANPDDPGRGALYGAMAGGAVAGLGNRLSKMGGSKPGVAASAPARIKRIEDMVAVGDKGVVDVARSMPKADVLEAASRIASQGVNGGVRITNLDEAIQIIDDAAEFRSFANDITRSDQGLAPYPELRTPMKSGAGEVVPFSKPKPAPGAGGKPQPVGAKAAPPPFKPIEGAERIDTTSWTPTEFNAARKQLNEMMQDRRTMSGQQLAELDREITSLRNALDPPIAPEFADVPMASRFNAPVDQPWPKGSPADTAIKKAIEGKNWTVQSVPLAKVIPTQDSVFFDYAKAAGRYAGDDRLPIVVKQGDQYFVADGHHRLMAQGGADQVRARVIDLAPPSKGPGGKPPTVQAGIGGKSQLPMDEASRMQRRKAWQAEKGPVEDKTWWHAGAMKDELDPTKGELGLHIGERSAAKKVAVEARDQRMIGARSDGPTYQLHEPQELVTRGVFAQAPDLKNFSDPGEYLIRRKLSQEWDGRYEAMWKQLDRAALAARRADPEKSNALWRDAVHKAARDHNISGWEYQNYFEGGTSRVVFGKDAARSVNAAFDPSQEGSSKLLSAFPGGTAAQAASGAGGAAYGYANPVDANEDGVIDDQDRAITATTLGLGGLTAAGLARNALSRGPRGVKPAPGARQLGVGGSGGIGQSGGMGPAGQKYVDQSVEHFGLTDDIREAGYILPDGRMLDLSGRHEMLGGDYVRQGGKNVPTGRDWQGGVRHTDHRELPFEIPEAKAREASFGNASTAHMLAFQQQTGAIRVMPGTGISVSVMPSERQIKALVTKWRRTYGDEPMMVDVDDALTGKNLSSIDVQRVTVEDVKRALAKAPTEEAAPTLKSGGGSIQGAPKSPPVSSAFGAKPPPASNAFGGGKGKPPPAAKPKSAVGGIAGRAAVGSAIGAGVGSIAEGQTGDAQAQMAEVAAQMAKLQKTIDGLQAVLDIYDTGTPEQIQAAVARGGKYTKPDGVIGRETSAQVAADRARIAVEMKAALAELDKGRARVKQLEEQAAFDKTRPGMALQAARQAAPWIGALGGALGGAKMRGGAVSKATAEAVKREASVNALLTPGPIKTGRDAATRAAVKGQPANINEYWIRGGAGDKVPFEANAKGDWRMRPKGKVMPASKLFPDGEPGLRKNDLAWIATGLSEAGLSTLGVDAAHKELAAAQAAVENDKTEANYERLERAHDMLSLAETMQRAGLGFAAGRLIGAYKTPYKSARPNVQNAEAEMARIAEYLQRLKK